MLFDFLIKRHECTHNNIPVDADEAYCPDCGELVRNKWFITRCSCCNIKRTSYIEYDKIKPETKYCPNCGSEDFYIQELDKIYFTDLKFAVLKKTVIPQNHYHIKQVWVEKENDLICEQKLIGINKH